MTDFLLMDRLAALADQTVKERVLYAKGVGAYGTFRPYMSMRDYTKATFLSNPEVETTVFARFSKMLGRSGSPDTTRSPKGIEVKFFTEEGNYDLVCQNAPVFFIHDGEKFPALVEALGNRKDTNLPDIESLWRFFAENPEAANMMVWLFSDKGTTKSYRNIEGYSVNTYRWIPEEGPPSLVRYKWVPVAGVRDISKNEAEFLAGFDPDAAARDFYEAIESGQYPEYELLVQMIPETARDAYGFDPECCTAEWPEEEIKGIKIGKMKLSRIPERFFEEVEKSAFSPANLVPGIAFSDDKMLPAMGFACNHGARIRGAWL